MNSKTPSLEAKDLYRVLSGPTRPQIGRCVGCIANPSEHSLELQLVSGERRWYPFRELMPVAVYPRSPQDVLPDVFRTDFPNSSGESATIHTVVTLGLDTIPTPGHYSLQIKHVLAFHGQGFLFCISSKNSPGTMCNGDVAYGTDAGVYQEVLRLGIEQLDVKEEEGERSFKERFALSQSEARSPYDEGRPRRRHRLPQKPSEKHTNGWK